MSGFATNLAPSIGDFVRRSYFSLLYAANKDPWGYESSEYEHCKYEKTINVIEGRRCARALEVGCSIGVFTAMLAERVDYLLAIDVAPAAVKRARSRLANLRNVEVVRAALPEWNPPGQFDLIVCSEVLYYLNETALLHSLRVLESSLTRTGSIVAVHRRGKGRSSPLHGDTVHELLIRHTTLRHAHSEINSKFRLDRLDATAERSPLEQARIDPA